MYYTTSNEAYSTVASVYQTFNFDSANASRTALDAELAVTAGNIYNVIANFGKHRYW